MVATYSEILGWMEAEQLFAAAMSDWRWRQATLELHARLADKQAVYAYEFAWKSPTNEGRLGAGHCVDIPYCFHNMTSPSTPYLIGDKAPVALADTMRSAWCHFIKSGVLANDATGEWPGYDLSRRATMMFDETSKLADDPHAARRLYWENRKVGG